MVYFFLILFSFGIGYSLNKGLSSTNFINDFIEYNIPFVYTISINEFILLFLLIIIFFMLLSWKHALSYTSVKELRTLLIRVIKIGILIMSFIIGTWGKFDFYNSENFTIRFEKITWITISIALILIFSNRFLFYFYCFNEKNKKELRKKEVLYSTRKKHIQEINYYLKNLKNISIVGEWGSGKTKLIEFFFESENEKGGKYSDLYEKIYIDISVYSENKKIIDIIDKKINFILEDKKIFRLSRDLSENIFSETNGWIKTLKNLFLPKEYLNDSKETLREKILEYENESGKKIVLCLDNIERISEFKRIINLFALIDEIYVDSIRKIYLYDEEYMEKIFLENKDTKFKEYIEKYSDVKIEITKVTVEEILEQFQDEFDKDIYLEVIKKFESREIINTREKIQVQEKIQNINSKLKNPRYLKNIISYCNNTTEIYPYDKKLDKKIKFEYKILQDFFYKSDENIDNIIDKVFFYENTYETRIQKEGFEILKKNQTFKKEFEIDKKLSELEKEILDKQDGKKIIEYSDLCRQLKKEGSVSEILKQITSYKVNTFCDVEGIVLLALNGIDIEIEKMQIYFTKRFWETDENIEAEKWKNYVKIKFLKDKFVNTKRLSRFFFETAKNYSDFYMESLKIEKILEENNYSFDEFLNRIEEKAKKLDKNQFENLKINESALKKEIEILKKIKFYGIDNEKRNKITEENFNLMTKNKIGIYEIIEKKGERIILHNDEIKEEITKENVEEYIEHFKSFSDNSKFISELLIELDIFKNPEKLEQTIFLE